MKKIVAMVRKRVTRYQVDRFSPSTARLCTPHSAVPSRRRVSSKSPWVARRDHPWSRYSCDTWLHPVIVLPVSAINRRRKSKDSHELCVPCLRQATAVDFEHIALYRYQVGRFRNDELLQTPFFVGLMQRRTVQTTTESRRPRHGAAIAG